MKTVSISKLRLNRETLRILNPSELEAVGGGMPTTSIGTTGTRNPVSQGADEGGIVNNPCNPVPCTKDREVSCK